MDPLSLMFGLFTTASLFLQISKEFDNTKSDNKEYDLVNENLRNFHKAIENTNRSLWQAKLVHAAFQEIYHKRFHNFNRIFTSDKVSEEELQVAWSEFRDDFEMEFIKNELDNPLTKPQIIPKTEYQKELAEEREKLKKSIESRYIDALENRYYEMCKSFNSFVEEANLISSESEKIGGFYKGLIKPSFARDMKHVLTNADQALKTLIDFQNQLFTIYNERIKIL